MATVRIRDLTKVFDGAVTALDDLDLDIDDGEFFALLGPSGCGKTTLLRTIAGLESPTSGSLAIGDRDVTRLAPGDRNVAMVFQDYALYPHMTVIDNIAYPLKVKKQPKDQRHATARDAGSSLSLDELMDRRPGQLSGGQQQRVALARAMATRPDLYLFDEPLSNLDARLRLEARTFLKRLQKELGVTTVYVTHDQAEALALADRMAVMEAGVIRQVGAPSEFFHRPANLFVAGFIGSTPMNLLDGTIDSDRVMVMGATLEIPSGARQVVSDGDRVIVGVRPEYVSLATGGGDGSIEGEVQILENLGTHFLVSIETGDEIVRALAPEGSEPEIGERVAAKPEPGRVLLYHPEGELIGAEEERTTTRTG